MPTFCISDLHAADRGPRDSFSYNGREARFNKFLDMVEQTRGRLLILGDLLDFWLVNLGAAITTYLPLLDRLAGMGATWVVGNHDNALAPLLGTSLMLNHPLFQQSCRPFEEEIGGRRFAFLHGHEADPYCCDLNPGIGEITAIISGLLEDRNKGPVRHGHAVADEFVGTLERALTLWRTLTFQHGRQTEMVAGVEKYRREKQCDVVVYGHTHEPGYIGDYHFNSGSWARQHDTYVVISDNGQASVWEWLGDRAIPHYATLGTV
jgi:UDP-2,3-diacylglucosamine pyrophosphatase LpxH